MSLRYGVPLFFAAKGMMSRGSASRGRAAIVRQVGGSFKDIKRSVASAVKVESGDNTMRSMLDGRCEKADVGGKVCRDRCFGRRL